VTIHDEPFTDKDVSIQAKGNNFFFLSEVDPVSKKPEDVLQVISLSADTVLNKGEFMKGMTLDISDGTTFLAFYNKSQILKIASCKLDITTPKAAKVADCRFHTNTREIGYGAISFLGNSNVAYFNKKEQKSYYCKLTLNSQDPTASVLTGCTICEGRDGRDIDLLDFHSTGPNNLKIFYMTNDSRIDLGVDIFELSNVEPFVKQVNSFKTFCNSSMDLKDRFYTISESFLDCYDKTRADELLIQGNLVPPDRSVPITIEQVHDKAKTIVQFEIRQFPRFIQAVNSKKSFPALVGFKGNYFKVPIGREYFSGNGINFELKGDLTNSLVANAGSFEFKIDGETDPNKFQAYYHTNGYSVMVTTENQVFIINCARKLEGTFVFKCVKVVDGIRLDDKVGEKVLATYHTQHLLVIATTYGQFIFFNKVSHASDSMALKGENRYLKQVIFKPKDALILISALVTDSKGVVSQISSYAFNEFAKLSGSSSEIYFYSVNTITRTSYQAETNQESGGDFCPRSISYEVTDSPVLDILNACETRDRRILRFSFKDERKPQQLSNSFIRVNELKNDQIQMCPDLDSVILTSIGSTMAVGVGYETSNIKQNLGLKELNVQKITKLICLGTKAFALGLLTNDGKFKIATYFTGKLRLANDRLHSLLEFSAADGYQDFSGAESEEYIFYNVFSNGKKTLFRMVYLGGPELFVRTNNRDEVGDAQIGCSNGVSNYYQTLPFSFRNQKNTVEISSKQERVKLEKKNYDLGNLCLINGPIFQYNLEEDVKVISITPRVSNITELFSSEDVQRYKSLYFSRLKTIRGFTFVLSQVSEKSQILMKFNDGVSNVTRNFVLEQTCHNFDVIEESNKTLGFVVALSCFFQNEKRIHVANISFDGRIDYQGSSSIITSSRDLGLAFTSTTNVKSNRYLLANIDENDMMTLYSFNFTTSTDKKNTRISFDSIVHSVQNGKIGLNSQHYEVGSYYK
jgi:hypothetical protein